MTNDFIQTALFPLEHSWHMVAAERCALLHVLHTLKPTISIEIGTFLGGSLRPIARASERVISFDIDPNQHRISPLFSNVEFIAGDSAETLPPIIDKINSSDHELNFILIDGSHETAGVTEDISNCLRYIPKTRPTAILMHDAGNPKVRRGIENAAWNDCKYVQCLDLDFVPSILYDRSDIRGQIWGGLAIALLSPTPRTGDLKLSRTFQASWEVLYNNSIHKDQ